MIRRHRAMRPQVSVVRSTPRILARRRVATHQVACRSQPAPARTQRWPIRGMPRTQRRHRRTACALTAVPRGRPRAYRAAWRTALSESTAAGRTGHQWRARASGKAARAAPALQYARATPTQSARPPPTRAQIARPWLIAQWTPTAASTSRRRRRAWPPPHTATVWACAVFAQTEPCSAAATRRRLAPGDSGSAGRCAPAARRTAAAPASALVRRARCNAYSMGCRRA
jgi:hypothetical protein